MTGRTADCSGGSLHRRRPPVPDVNGYSEASRVIDETTDSSVGQPSSTLDPSQLEDQVGELLAASGATEMSAIAKRLRRTALTTGRLLMRPLSANKLRSLTPSVRVEQETRLMELVDLATDVVNAIDYLLNLLDSPTVTYPRLMLSAEADPYRSYDTLDNDAPDRLTRRWLDARGAVVRVGMRLVVGLGSDILNNLSN
jgi:hypothetical protein